jgi:hypothetical protein
LDLHAAKITAFIKGKEKFLDYALFANDLFDLCETYYDEDEEDMDLSKRNLVTHLCDFYDEAMQGRVVTSLEWSLKHPDLFLTGYSQPSNAYEQSGLIQLWSLANKKAPELTISCQTEITNAIFHNLNPKVLLAGTFTGQVLLYDIKSKPVPIQKTPMDLGGAFQTHSYPIVSLTVIGTESNSNIISISSDGVLCQWSLANFSRPITRIHIKKRKDERTFAEKTANQIDDIGVLCSAYNPYFNNNILLGSDNNLIYYENKPCLNRFNKLSINKYARGVGGCKTIINNFYDDIKDIQILSAHTCSKHENDYILTRDDGIVLKHIFTKSLEEWIMKMTHNIDNSYMARWHGYIFNEYFKWNEITNEKLDAIDDLLNKYNIKYNILIEELYGEFLQKYIERNIDNVNTISCITFIDTENIDTLNNWIDYHYKLGIKKFFVGYCCDYSLLPKNDFIVYVNTKNEDNIYDKLLNMAKMDNNIQYVLSLSINQYINIKNNDNHLIYILKKYFSHYNSSIQIKEEYTGEQPNEKCSICINIKHKDIDKIQMIDKYCCSLYIDGYVIDPNILTLTTHNK